MRSEEAKTLYRKHLGNVRGIASEYPSLSRVILERAGISISAPRPLPWLTLPKVLADAGVYIDNYPDGVLSPLCDGSADCGSICKLKPQQLQLFIQSLKGETRDPLRIVKVKNASGMFQRHSMMYPHAPIARPQGK